MSLLRSYGGTGVLHQPSEVSTKHFYITDNIWHRYNRVWSVHHTKSPVLGRGLKLSCSCQIIVTPLTCIKSPLEQPPGFWTNCYRCKCDYYLKALCFQILWFC